MTYLGPTPEPTPIPNPSPAPAPKPAPPAPPAPVLPEPAPVPGTLPLRDAEDIQGNVLAAYNQNYQSFLVYTLPSTPDVARSWLRDMTPLLASTKTVEDHNNDVREAHAAGQPHTGATWVNLGLTAAGIKILAADSVAANEKLALFQALVGGPVRPGISLGDTGASDPARWRFGAPGQPVLHAIITVSADTDDDRVSIADKVVAIAATHGASLVDRVDAAALFDGTGKQSGHEHFGHKDGVSQPGVVGFHAPNPARPGERKDHPGTVLVAAGEFLLGEPAQTGTVAAVPSWLQHASFQVLRPLQQDVTGWWDQAHRYASAGFGSNPAEASALLMGRYPSGNTLAATPTAVPTRVPTVRSTDSEANDFTFAPGSIAAGTPSWAHISKTNPRDGSEANHRLMRRGIAYGPVFDHTNDVNDAAERGLVFHAYMASIENQFEFIQGQWANSTSFHGGVDPVIGDTGQTQVSPTVNGRSAPAPLARFVTTRGTVYAVALTIPVLTRLATDGTLPA